MKLRLSKRKTRAGNHESDTSAGDAIRLHLIRLIFDCMSDSASCILEIGVDFSGKGLKDIFVILMQI